MWSSDFLKIGVPIEKRSGPTGESQLTAMPADMRIDLISIFSSAPQTLPASMKVARRTVIAGCVGVAGSARIGKRCRIGGAAGISGHLEICDGTTISAMTLVTKSIRKPGVYSSGAPLMPHDEWLRWAVRTRRGDKGGET